MDGDDWTKIVHLDVGMREMRIYPVDHVIPAEIRVQLPSLLL
ncbi:hypothetical protein JOC74_003591 [Bacillus capparidis]|uniref:Uncharacterized protein n=1 Tax=Bacillus capparidis TaxID=1840411 RepID=A0ABS4D0C1_9BACI|nr:hypothetical protein [Bacillus capparidis]